MMFLEIIPVYTDIIPESYRMEEGKLYISREHSTAIHLCPNGCRREVVTPLGDGEWTLTEKDGKVTLRPSIGNWKGQHPYHAHYYITENRIEMLP